MGNVAFWKAAWRFIFLQLDGHHLSLHQQRVEYQKLLAESEARERQAREDTTEKVTQMGQDQTNC